MRKRTHSTWLSKRETRIYCIDFSGYGNDRDRVIAERMAVEAVAAGQPENSMLVTVDLSQTQMMDEIIQFITGSAADPHSPYRKMAVMGLSPFRRWWYQQRRGLVWPKTTRFFQDYESAKDWLIGDGF